MHTKEIKAFIARLEEIEIEIMGVDWDSDRFLELESEVYEIEEELIEFPYDENESLLKKAERLISKIKEDNDFDEDFDFDEEYDDDFDFDDDDDDDDEFDKDFD